MKKRLAIPTAGLAVASLLLWGVGPAFAADSASASDNAIAAIQAVAPSVLRGAVPAQKRAPSKALSKFASGDANTSLASGLDWRNYNERGSVNHNRFTINGTLRRHGNWHGCF